MGSTDHRHSLPAQSRADARANQKRRTRAALVAAACELVRGGASPGVAEVADAALVSRATAYRYFPSQEALLAEAQLDILVKPDLEQIAAVADTAGDAAARVDAVIRADHALTVRHEPAFRAMLRASLTPRADDPLLTPRRPANRLRWLTTALAPVRARLGEARCERLVAALAMVIATEALVVQRDICGLDAAEAEAVQRWAAQALLAAALAEADHDEGAGGRAGTDGHRRDSSFSATGRSTGSPSDAWRHRRKRN
ncbi:MAG TPA: TetR/AcrR family transcriptional regulator [Dehalococcoidia bacterium]|nr:TetR/AcrR family transcriptional regulator [Dehalococcoidia bacterium]